MEYQEGQTVELLTQRTDSGCACYPKRGDGKPLLSCEGWDIFKLSADEAESLNKYGVFYTLD
jgi:hypothetical protein